MFTTYRAQAQGGPPTSNEAPPQTDEACGEGGSEAEPCWRLGTGFPLGPWRGLGNVAPIGGS